MFVLRSAFWLTIGFLLVAPHGTDFGAGATALKDQAVSAGLEAGERLIVGQILDTTRLPDLLLSSPAASVDLPMQVSPTDMAVFPRSRPASLG
jgi:hypothetical protein